MEFHPLANPAAAPVDHSPWHQHPPLPDRSSQQRLHLTEAQVKEYDRDGFVLLKAKDVWTPAELKLILASTELMQDWEDRPGKYMKYYEPNLRDPNAPKLLCRIENFAQYNPGMDFILNGDKLVNMCTDLFNERAIMYKEKINYKLPGGAGFAPHQDVAAGWWMYKQTIHMSCLVSIDPATIENGCLEVVRGEHMSGMMSDDWKEIPAGACEKLKWESIPTEPGDVLFFDSYVPHKSAPNMTQKSRRVLYVTYAKTSEGDFRDRYYADKRASYPPDCERDPSKSYAYKI